MIFKIGDLIIYSAHGICRIDDIRESAFLERSQTCYVLHPVENPTLSISIPVNSDKVIMLGAMTPTEADAILSLFQSPGMEWIENRTFRSKVMANILKTGDRAGIAKVVNTLMRKKDELDHSHKKMPEQDNRILAASQKILFGDLALSYHCTVEEISNRINETISSSLQSV